MNRPVYPVYGATNGERPQPVPLPPIGWFMMGFAAAVVIFGVGEMYR